MATYKGINGFAVQSVASDPTFDEGQVWYNNTSYSFKLSAISTSGSWATSGNLNTARGIIASAGTDTAGLATGGNAGTTNCEKFNGSVWTNTTAFPTPTTYMAGCGTQTAALTAGGGSGYVTDVKKFNGTTWSANPNGIPYGAEASSLLGIQTAAIWFGGGGAPGPGYPAECASFNGTSFSSTPSLNNDKRYGSMATGTQTAGLAAVGGSPQTANTEKWNGSTWTNSGNLPFVNYNVSGNGVGTQGAAMLWLGSKPGPNTTTQYFNGSTWSDQSASLTYSATAVAASGGTQSACFSAGGGPAIATTNNWSGAGSQLTKTITTS